MPIKTGTYTIADLSSNVFAGQTVMSFGLERLNEAIQADLEMHNARTLEMLRELCDISTERSTIYGTNAEGEMHQKDEFTRGPTQKIARGSKVEFPLDAYQFAVGWTADYLRRATVQDLALRQISARQAHLRALQRGIRDALFGPTNYTWVDRWKDGNSLAVKRLVNADGAPIPNGPNGETFDGSTHTHYDAIDWSDAGTSDDDRVAALQDLVSDIVEHGHGDDARIYINRAQESDLRALKEFTPLHVPNVVLRTTEAPEQRLDITKVNNRLVGYFEGIPVFTKSWVPAGYMFAFSAGDPRKPLRYRQSEIQQEQGLFIAGEVVSHPLQAQYMEAWFGFGVLTRTNGAVLYTGSTTYAAP